MKKTRQKHTRPGWHEADSAPAWTPEALGLAPAQYAAALHYLFDRPVPEQRGQEWFWSIDEAEFHATPLEWTRIQTVLFANAGLDLAPYNDEQVGMGLNYLMSNCISDVPYAAIDESVPLADAMRMMQAFPRLWQDCIGPRLAHVRTAIGQGTGPLNFVCHMWFDVWPTFFRARHQPEWRDAHWHVLSALLDVPCRAVQIAALHGIGHDGEDLQRDETIDRRIDAFIRSLQGQDEELAHYARAAQAGMVL